MRNLFAFEKEKRCQMNAYFVILVISIKIHVGARQIGDKCSQPPSTRNGYYYPKRRRYYAGESIQYACDRGYSLEGYSSVSYCFWNGRWSSRSGPNCVSQTCNVPRAPRNGKVEPRNKRKIASGETVTFSCNSGYELVGNSQAECQKSGKFSSKSPVCKRRATCQLPVSFKNGKMRPKSRFLHPGQTVEFKCDEGYALHGSSTAECHNVGRLSSKLPECVRGEKYCTITDEPKNGSVFPPLGTKRVIGSKIFYRCDQGFLMQGEGVTTCGENRKFLSAVPQCTRYCKAKSIENGFVFPLLDEFYLEETVEIGCNDGYKLIGSKSASCLRDGTFFFEKAPSCVPATITCLVSRRPDFGTMSKTEGEALAAGETVTYNCNLGYVLVGSEFSTCQDKGHLFPRRPECVPDQKITKSCEIPRAPKNGSVYGEFNVKKSVDVGDKVFFNCDDGFVLIGDDSSTCMENYKFDLPDPVCIMYVCKRPDVSQYGRLIEDKLDYIIGELVIYSCIDGYVMIGSQSAVCQEDGNFLPNEVPVCRRKDPTHCQKPKNVEFPAYIVNEKSSYDIGEMIKFKCNSGYHLVTKDEVSTCEANGRFDSFESPKCRKNQADQRRTCAIPIGFGEIINVHPMQRKYEVGDVVTFTCRGDYLYLVGDRSTVCGPDGKFHYRDQPRCRFSFTRDMMMY